MLLIKFYYKLVKLISSLYNLFSVNYQYQEYFRTVNLLKELQKSYVMSLVMVSNTVTVIFLTQSFDDK